MKDHYKMSEQSDLHSNFLTRTKSKRSAERLSTRVLLCRDAERDGYGKR